MSSNSNDAIIILGHGSRVPGAGEAMLKVAQRLKDAYGYSIVEVCNMSRLGPHFDETLDKCVAQGAANVILIPYFLHEGLHIKLDIPEMMQASVKKHPGVRVVLGRSLGFDPALVELVNKRIEQSRGLCDVRDISLPPKDKYPVPPGQDEFVPMPPEEAERWRGVRGENEN